MSIVVKLESITGLLSVYTANVIFSSIFVVD